LSLVFRVSHAFFRLCNFFLCWSFFSFLPFLPSLPGLVPGRMLRLEISFFVSLFFLFRPFSLVPIDVFPISFWAFLYPSSFSLPMCFCTSFLSSPLVEWLCFVPFVSWLPHPVFLFLFRTLRGSRFFVIFPCDGTPPVALLHAFFLQILPLFLVSSPLFTFLSFFPLISRRFFP